MYREDYFYGISDIMQFNIFAGLLKDQIKKEERGIIKVFKKNKEVVIIESIGNHDEYLKDTRKDKSTDILTYDLVFLKSFDRYYSDYELPNMIYEYIEGIGSWYRVKIDGYNPQDKLLRPFYHKKGVKKEDLNKYSSSEDELKILKDFYEIKGNIKFNKPSDIKKFFKDLC